MEQEIKSTNSTVVGPIKAGVPPQAFQNGVNQLPANFQQQYLQS